MDEVQYLLEEKKLWNVPPGQLEEIVVLELEEYLDNLGYIHIDQNDDQRLVDWDVIIEGIRTYRKDYREYFTFIAAHPKIFRHRYPLGVVARAPGDRLTEEELTFLAHLCSLEGEFALHEFPEAELLRNQLLRRIMSYRLSVFGLRLRDQSPVDPGLPAPSLDDLGKWARVSSFAERVALIGDVHELCRTMVRQEGYPDSLYCHIVYMEDKGQKIKDEGDLEQRRHRFEDRVHKLMPGNGRQWYEERNSRKKILPLLEDPLNQFMARVVQVKLWLLGTYQGKLDSDIGPLSVEAIQHLIDFLFELQQRVTGDEAGERERAIQMSDIIVQANNPVWPFSTERYWALNVHFLLRHIFPVLIDKYTGGTIERASIDDAEAEAKREQEEEEVQNITVCGEIGSLTDQVGTRSRGLEDGQRDEDQLYQALQAEIEGTADAPRKRPKKVRTRGGRDFLRSIKRFFGKIVRGIVRGIAFIIEAIRKLFTWIKNGIQILLREIKKVFLLLRKSIRFVFGKKIIKSRSINSFIITDYDFDFDSITHVSGTEKVPHRAHIHQNLEILSALQQTSKFVGTVLFFAIQIGNPGFGWIKMGIKLINFLKRDNFSFQRFSFPSFANPQV